MPLYLIFKIKIETCKPNRKHIYIHTNTHRICNEWLSLKLREKNKSTHLRPTLQPFLMLDDNHDINHFEFSWQPHRSIFAWVNIFGKGRKKWTKRERERERKKTVTVYGQSIFVLAVLLVISSSTRVPERTKGRREKV